MKCKICDRKAEVKGFCMLHFDTYQNVVNKFDIWKNASEVSWADYLSAIQKNSLTGEWAKEVVMHLIKEGRENVW